MYTLKIHQFARSHLSGENRSRNRSTVNMRTFKAREYSVKYQKIVMILTDSRIKKEIGRN